MVMAFDFGGTGREGAIGGKGGALVDATSEALIVIPTYNEADNLEPLVREIMALPVAFDMLVVDDNSPDGTGDIAGRLAEELSAVHVLHRSGKQGLGTAYIAGFGWALAQGYDYILGMDCDFSHHPCYLPTFMDLVREADLVVGSRYVLDGGTTNWSLLRKIVSAGGNLFARTMLGLRTRDSTSGFRCYRREIIERVPWDEINLRGYGFQIGVVYHVERLGGRVAEFPITFDDRRVGQSKMSSAIALEAFSFVTRLALTEGRVKPGGAPVTARNGTEVNGLE
jgi:dolichol-phosphate mannosyltransferase